MYKIYILIILLSLPLVLSTACGEGDGCDITCPEGDKDCTCNILKGYECSVNQDCKGTLLKNYGNKMCCSKECTESQLKEDTKVLILNNENLQKEEQAFTPQVKKRVGIGFFILFLLVILGFLTQKVLRKFNQ